MQIRTKGDLTAGLAVDKVHALRASLPMRVRDATSKVLAENRELEKRIESRVVESERGRFKLLMKASEIAASQEASSGGEGGRLMVWPTLTDEERVVIADAREKASEAISGYIDGPDFELGFVAGVAHESNLRNGLAKELLDKYEQRIRNLEELVLDWRALAGAAEGQAPITEYGDLESRTVSLGLPADVL